MARTSQKQLKITTRLFLNDRLVKHVLLINTCAYSQPVLNWFMSHNVIQRHFLLLVDSQEKHSWIVYLAANTSPIFILLVCGMDSNRENKEY